jgi:hypothetical protein
MLPKKDQIVSNKLAIAIYTSHLSVVHFIRKKCEQGTSCSEQQNKATERFPTNQL